MPLTGEVNKHAYAESMNTTRQSENRTSDKNEKQQPNSKLRIYSYNQIQKNNQETRQDFVITRTSRHSSIGYV